MSVPGISGGTTAVALGCYGSLLHATARIREKENFRFLLRYALGGAIGFFLISRCMGAFLKYLPLTATLTFFGAAAGGIFPFLKPNGKRHRTLNGGLIFLLSFLCIPALTRLPLFKGTVSPLLMFPLGLLISLGVILPGVSTSHLLLIFGLYERISSVSSLGDLLPLIPLTLGLIAGTLLFARPLERWNETSPESFRCSICGLSTGSLIPLIQPCIGNPQVAYLPIFQTVNGVILCAAAFLLIRKISDNETKM